MKSTQYHWEHKPTGATGVELWAKHNGLPLPGGYRTVEDKLPYEHAQFVTKAWSNILWRYWVINGE